MALMVFVAVLCLYIGMKVITGEERNKVFNKRPIEVKDVKKYNIACGILVIGFGVVAEITIYFMISTTGWISTVMTLLLIAEAFIVVLIYNQIEKKMIKMR